MDERQIDLCKYRIEKAKQCLDSAKVLVMSEDYEGAVNRSYYAIFNSVRSILALEGVDYSKHSGVISHFHKNYVKTEIFDKEYSKILTEAFSVRNDADYDDYSVISKEKTIKQIENAETFLEGIRKYIEEQLPDSGANL